MSTTRWSNVQLWAGSCTLVFLYLCTHAMGVLMSHAHRLSPLWRSSRTMQGSSQQRKGLNSYSFNLFLLASKQNVKLRVTCLNTSSIVRLKLWGLTRLLSSIIHAVDCILGTTLSAAQLHFVFVFVFVFVFLALPFPSQLHNCVQTHSKSKCSSSAMHWAWIQFAQIIKPNSHWHLAHIGGGSFNNSYCMAMIEFLNYF